jgi:hypothetical protein
LETSLTQRCFHSSEAFPKRNFFGKLCFQSETLQTAAEMLINPQIYARKTG